MLRTQHHRQRNCLTNQQTKTTDTPISNNYTTGCLGTSPPTAPQTTHIPQYRSSTFRLAGMPPAALRGWLGYPNR